MPTWLDASVSRIMDERKRPPAVGKGKRRGVTKAPLRRGRRKRR